MKKRDQINHNVTDYMKKHPNVTLDELVSLFGDRNSKDQSRSHIQRVMNWQKRQG